MWCREGYWQNGILFNGRDGQAIHDPNSKLIPIKAVQEAARRDVAKLWAMIPDFLTGTRHKPLKAVV